MNREIKFKFWLGHTKQMTHPHTLEEISKLITDFTDDIIPLQYTGLNDKNGVEIYEGDIVAGLIKGQRIGVNDIVEYKNGRFLLRYRNASLYDWLFEDVLDLSLEVIGNIFSSPELLNN